MTGVDVPIDLIKTHFEGSLWPLIANKTFHGRTYRNIIEREGKSASGRISNEELVAEIYVGDSEYEEVMFDGSLNVLSFFDVEEDIEQANFDEQQIREVNIIFAVNLEAIYGTRDTEQAYYDVYEALDQFSMLIEINKITTGLPAYGDLSTNRLKEYNMQPYHTFSFNTEMKVSYNGC